MITGLRTNIDLLIRIIMIMTILSTIRVSEVAISFSTICRYVTKHNVILQTKLTLEFGMLF